MAGQWPLVGRSSQLERIETALTDSECTGVVVAGPAGVGKSRLASETLVLAARRGFATNRVLGTKSSASLVLGAFAPLLPEVLSGGAGSPDDLLRQGLGAVAALGEGGRLALLVDDAHLLDDASATLTYQLAATGSAFVVATVRSGDPAPDAVVALWKDELAQRIELGPIDAESVAALLATVLDGHVEGGTVKRLAEGSAGNPLYLRELIQSGQDSGVLVHDGGIWRLAGPLPVSARLKELVAGKIGALGERERQALELLAYGEPIGIGLLEARCGEKALDALDARSLIAVAQDGRRVDARLAHPLYGEVVRAGTSQRRARAVHRDLAGLVRGSGSRRRDDDLRVATWSLEGGAVQPDQAPSILASAVSARARWDLPLAERLGRAALEVGGGFDAGLLVGQVCLLQGRAEAAEQGLAALAPMATTDEQRVALATTRTDILFFGLGRREEALAVAVQARGSVATAEWKRDVIVKQAELLYLVGRTLDALELIEPILGQVQGRTLVALAPTAALCLMMVGRLTSAIELTQRAHASHLALAGPPLTFGPHTHLVVRGVALGHAGRLDEAEALASGGYQRALEAGSQEVQALFGQLCSWLLALRGQVAAAARMASEASNLYRELHWAPFLRFALISVAHASALAGAPRSARGALDELGSLGIPDTDTSGALVFQARAWTAIAEGELATGRGYLSDAVELAQASDDRVLEAAALHDLARLGEAREVVGRLEELSQVVEGELVTLRTSHARAVAERDPDALQAVVERFEALGFWLWAAEAAAGVAVLRRRAGEPRAAAASAQRAATLAARCEGATTPGLQDVTSQALLTAREREVATLAASGRSNQEIADHLGVSVRTVEAHLQHAFTKLGLRRRTDLLEALAGGS